jgi:hypothetical protein
MESIARRIASKNYQVSLFTSSSATRANEIKYGKQYPDPEEEDDLEEVDETEEENLASVSGDTNGSEDNREFARAQKATNEEEELNLVGRRRKNQRTTCGIRRCINSNNGSGRDYSVRRNRRADLKPEKYGVLLK